MESFIYDAITAPFRGTPGPSLCLNEILLLSDTFICVSAIATLTYLDQSLDFNITLCFVDQKDDILVVLHTYPLMFVLIFVNAGPIGDGH